VHPEKGTNGLSTGLFCFVFVILALVYLPVVGVGDLVAPHSTDFTISFLFLTKLSLFLPPIHINEGNFFIFHTPWDKYFRYFLR
jgi:hypothetical protein